MPIIQAENRIEDTAGAYKKRAVLPSAPEAYESTALWRLNHKIVSDLFEEYEKVDIRSRKKSLVSRICVDLTIHTQVEEEILYPAVNEILKDKRLLRQATGKHAMLKGLIAEVEDAEAEADEDDFDAKVQALSDYVKDHVKEEQNQMFPRVTAMNLDVTALSAKVVTRKEQLVAERAHRA